MLSSNAPTLQETAKRNIVQHPASLTNIFNITDTSVSEKEEICDITASC